MLKKIISLKGTTELSKNDQKQINGGASNYYCSSTKQCQIRFDEQAVVCVRNWCIFL